MGIGSAPPGTFSRPATKSREKGEKQEPVRKDRKGRKEGRKEGRKKERKKETRATGGVRRKGKGEEENITLPRRQDRASQPPPEQKKGRGRMRGKKITRKSRPKPTFL